MKTTTQIKQQVTTYLVAAFTIGSFVFFGTIMAISILGMAGAFDEAQACISCAGGVR